MLHLSISLNNLSLQLHRLSICVNLYINIYKLQNKFKFKYLLINFKKTNYILPGIVVLYKSIISSNLKIILP